MGDWTTDRWTTETWNQMLQRALGPPPKPPPPPPPKEAPVPRTPTKKTTTKKTAAKPTRKPARKPPVRVTIDDPGEDNQNINALAYRQTPTVVEDATRHPESTPCRVCGGQVDPACRFDTWGPWRQHAHCSRVAAYPPARVQAAAAALAVGEVTITDAALVEFTVACYSDKHPNIYPAGTRTRDRMPWRHVDRRALVKAVKNLPDLRVEAGLDPARCAYGPCAVCGVVEATGWMETELRWPDGSPAPVCGDCWPWFEQYGEPTFADDLAGVVSAALTRVVPFVGEHIPDKVVPFLSSGAEATGERWPHLNPDAVESYRWATWTKHPDAAPVEHREEACRRRVAAAAVVAAQTAARVAEERERLDTFGF